MSPAHPLEQHILVCLHGLGHTLRQDRQQTAQQLHSIRVACTNRARHSTIAQHPQRARMRAALGLADWVSNGMSELRIRQGQSLDVSCNNAALLSAASRLLVVVGGEAQLHKPGGHAFAVPGNALSTNSSSDTTFVTSPLAAKYTWAVPRCAMGWEGSRRMACKAPACTHSCSCLVRWLCVP
jgi:hypothetical protein